MKTQTNGGRIIMAVAAMGLASAWSLAAADTGNNAGKWYLGGDAGVNILQDVGGIKYNGAPQSGSIKFDVGSRVDLSVGYNVTENCAVELESGFTYNSVSSVGGNPANGAQTYQIPLLVNGIYKYSFNDKWQGYGGLGVGGVATMFDSGGNGSDTDFQFGYQAELGVKYLINANWECDLGYKFLGTLDHEWTFNGNKVQSDPSYAHSILLSLTYKF